MPNYVYEKQIEPEDIEKMKTLAIKLNREKSASVRLVMQQKFVREMGDIYGHEKATRMLSQVWRISVKALEAEA